MDATLGTEARGAGPPPSTPALSGDAAAAPYRESAEGVSDFDACWQTGRGTAGSQRLVAAGNLKLTYYLSFAAFDIERQSLDTAGSALTGRHQPAAREHSHLFWSESCACAPSFSLVSAGYRRFMKEGRNDRFEVSLGPSVSRLPPQTG